MNGRARRVKGRPAGARVRNRWWWAAVVVAVLIAGLASEAVERSREADRAAAFAAVPGVVADLRSPPGTAWEAAPGYVLGAADGGVVISMPLRASVSVAALEVADGSTRWSVTYTADGAQWCTAVIDPGVLCWQGAGAAGSAVLLDPRTGEETARVDDVVVRAGAASVEGDLVVLRATEVARVDPVTGETVWAVAVPDRYWGSRGRLEVIEVDGLVAVLGPRTYVLDPGTGEVLMEEEGFWGVVAVPEGFAMRSGLRAWRLHDRDGTEVTELPGQPLEPTVTDGSRPEILVVDTGSDHVAVNRNGRARWSFGDDSGRVVLRREGAVVRVDPGGVEARDLLTGRQRWRWEQPGLLPAAGAVTDGRVLVVVGRSGEGTAGHAIDLDTGEWRWTGEVPGGTGGVPHLMTLAGNAYTLTAQHRLVWWTEAASPAPDTPRGR